MLMVRSAAVLFKKLLKTYLSIVSDFNEETCIQETDNQYYGVFIWLTSVVKKKSKRTKFIQSVIWRDNENCSENSL